MEGAAAVVKKGISPAAKAMWINGLLVFTVVVLGNLATDFVKTKMANARVAPVTPPVTPPAKP